MAYAEVQDLAARWRALTPDEAERAATLLDDAAFDIDQEFPPPVDMTDAELEARILVSVDMVKRAMSVGDSMVGVTSHSEGTGPFQEQRTFANPMGDLYLTKRDRKRLGAVGQQIGTIPFRDPVPPVWWAE